ncbi:MAG TPA: hypothetical protein VGM37_02550 [Armatimonadota bacterium]
MELKAGVVVRDGFVYIRNGNSFDYVDLRLELNPGLISGGWEVQWPVIGAGHTVKVPIWRFTKGDGERFNLYRYEVKHLAIHCDTRPNHGRGNWFGGFK